MDSATALQSAVVTMGASALPRLKEIMRSTYKTAPESAIDSDPKADSSDNEVSHQTTPATATPCISKSQSVKMLKELWKCNDLNVARELAVPIMERHLHCGKGLYPIAAARAMSRIDGGFNDAVTILFLVLYRSLILLEQDSTAMWSSLRKGSGAATRVLKEVDAVLSFIILQHWTLMVKRATELDWDPTHIIDTTNDFWNDLLESSPPPAAKPRGSKHGMPHLLQRDKPQILKLSRRILHLAHIRRMAVLKATKVAGHILPQELVDAIADLLFDRKGELQADATLTYLRAQGYPAVGIRMCVENPRNRPEEEDCWDMCFTIKGVGIVGGAVPDLPHESK